ncbi:cysteine--tRNA ligase [Aquisediminimonas sediminicola]|uniref:cysteine--tRNA ligase n=1 Tax=Alteraquisediminimonas sediminicola TaxID=2676787 RepID=UPI001C8EAFE2|nr:cysteine--tRNA ligase [Aquisediminimonas sediminicola]
MSAQPSSPMGAPLVLFNSFTREAAPFTPIDPAMVRMYSCGPTVYSFAHLGNLRAYVFTDTLRRVMEYKGYNVTHVINITDVGHLTSDADSGDDKMEAAAKKTGKSIWDIAAFYTDAFKQDIHRLNIKDPSRWSVATEHVDDMIHYAEKIAPEHCYTLDSGLYFDVSTLPEYGKLAGAATHDATPVESRIDPVDGKRHPQDFAIWRASPKDEQRQMEWDSPWGKGAPGWHLECSVMSMKYLGEQFDIHTGGIDHREIHHCNEIAQNQAFTGSTKTGANYWMHNNFLVDRDGKMSKSKGGFSTLQSVIDRGIHPLAYRLFCISAHYRSELEFSGDNVAAALTRLKRLVMGVSALRDRAEGTIWQTYDRTALEAGLPAAAIDALTRFDAAIADDLMLPRALPLVEEVLSMKKISVDDRLRAIASMDLVLGLNLMTINRAGLRVRPADAQITEDEINAILDQRKQARADKDYAESDRLRDALAAKGVEVMDGDPLGWDWALHLG